MFNSSYIQILDIWQTFVRYLQTKGRQFAYLVAALVFLKKKVLKRLHSEFLKSHYFYQNKEYKIK